MDAIDREKAEMYYQKGFRDGYIEGSNTALQHLVELEKYKTSMSIVIPSDNKGKTVIHPLGGLPTRRTQK